MEPDKIIAEARARITWGDSAASVRDYLVQNGRSKAETDVKIKAIIAERNAEIRKIGIKNTLLGILILTVSSTLLYLDIKNLQTPGAIGWRRGGEFGFFGFGIFYGLWKLVNGIIYLVHPQSEKGSITDMLE